MRIYKIGHSCILVEEGGAKILFDPGNVTTEQTEVHGLDAIIITHIHADHFDMKTLPAVVSNNPGAVVIANSEVGAVLDKAKIKWQKVEDGEETKVKEVRVQAFGKEHHPIYPGIRQVMNTGYLISGRLYHAGDAYFKPPAPVEVLAAPFGAPWGTVGESIDYVKNVMPKVCFPVHDGMLKIPGPFHRIPDEMLTPAGIKFVSLSEGQDLDVR